MCPGATTQDASLGHLDHPRNARLKANYFNVVSAVVAWAWYSEATRVPAGVPGCTGNFASDTPRSFGVARHRYQMANICIAATSGLLIFSSGNRNQTRIQKTSVRYLTNISYCRANVHHR
jgi:hypothetical protein